MFDIGFWELVILFGLGLIILGPERLPKAAMQLGNWAGQARRMARTLTTQIRDELDVDLNRPFDSGYTPGKKPAPTDRRPGVNDLKPGESAHVDAGPETSSDDASAAADAADQESSDSAG
jgi:sec-independent protein translocase protein TatB